jgi:hypothetical protein
MAGTVARGEVGCKRLEKQRRERAPKRVEDRFTRRRVLSSGCSSGWWEGKENKKRKAERKQKENKWTEARKKSFVGGDGENIRAEGDE